MLNLSTKTSNVTKDNMATESEKGTEIMTSVSTEKSNKAIKNKKGTTTMELFNYDTIKSTAKNGIKDQKINHDDLNDKGLSRMFADIFRDVLRYNPQSKHWYYYNGKVWKEDAGNLTVKKFAKLFVDEFISHCENMSFSKSEQEKIAQLTSMAKRNTLVHDAECELPVSKEDFDRPTLAFNCQNGTLNLSNLNLYPHDPSMMISKISNAEYIPDAQCERWEQFIDEVMEGDKEKIDYLQRILGYCLTGEAKEEKFYIFYGATSRNGKSTLLETVSHVLGGTGGYSSHVATGSFSGKKELSAASPRSDIARLAGVRMAITSELPASMLLDAGLLKAMTGRDKITVRHLYSSEIEFTSQFKLFMNTNHLPKITDNSVFESKRVYVVKFNRHFTEQEQDKNLKSEFLKPENMSGILNWLIEGWKKVSQGKDKNGNDVEKGMTPPQSVIDATAHFREDCDKIGCFMDECLEGSDNNIKLKDLYEAYQQWTHINGYACEGKAQFKTSLDERNLLSKTGSIDGKTIRNVIKGYAFKIEMPQKDAPDKAAA